MKLATRLIAITLVLMFIFSNTYAQNDMNYFITRSGNKLMEGSKEYRFISFNIPNLHLVEDNMAFKTTNEWRYPDEFELTDALSTIKHLGGRAVRTYVISVCKPEGPNAIPCHVKKPGEFNEEGFRALDKVLEIANRVGVRVIIPLVDNWIWWGGIKEYADFRGKPKEAFWTDREIIEDFKKTVSFVLNRRNTYTGTLYKDDKAVLAWETGNELYSQYPWAKEIAAYIKSLDKNHLVLDGYFIGAKEIIPEALDDPNIDIVSSHHYPNVNKKSMADEILRYSREIAGKKPYIVGEFGFVPLAEMEKVLDTTINNGLAGAMSWSIRYRNRDGGFYWHSEPSGAGLYKAYHYPGFATGEAYEETALINLIKTKAFQIQGLPVPPIVVPASPKLLPINSVAEISWQGSVAAASYDVERATTPTGPWSIIGMDVDDTQTQYRHLFWDPYTEQGNSYYYRVRAKNSAGTSEPSNVVGPVRADAHFIVDELGDFSRTFARGGALSLETKNARPYKEDATRLKGNADSWVMYRSFQPLRYAKVWSFMEGAQKDFEFYISKDGVSFVKVEPKVSPFPTAINQYNYKLPVQYELEGISSGNHYLKIVYRTDAQIGLVELRHGK